MSWMRTKQAVEYAGKISERTLRRWKKNGLRFARVDGIDLFRPDWIDEYIQTFEVKENEARSKAEEIFQNLRSMPK